MGGYKYPRGVRQWSAQCDGKGKNGVTAVAFEAVLQAPSLRERCEVES
jgi:hypothetical protein